MPGDIADNESPSCRGNTLVIQIGRVGQQGVCGFPTGFLAACRRAVDSALIDTRQLADARHHSNSDGRDGLEVVRGGEGRWEV